MAQLDLERISVVKPGIYKIRIDEVDDSSNGPSGFLNIKMNCSILSSSGKPTGRTTWTNLSMSPKARFKIDKFLDAINAPEEGKVSPKSFKGKTLWVRIEKGKNNRGETVSQITDYLTDLEMESIQATEVPDVEYSEENYSAPKEFSPSASLDDDDEPSSDTLSNILSEDSEDEDILF